MLGIWITSLLAIIAYIRYERRQLEIFVEAVYAKKVDMARVEEKLVAMDDKLTEIKNAVVK